MPLILNIHGGPAGVFQQTFLGGRGVYPLATFSARGYAILRPNPRGSSGYGTEFRRANTKDWGFGDYQDLMTGVDKVIAMGVADPERLGCDGLELRRIHDVVDRHANTTLQSSISRRAGNKSDELQWHGRYPGVYSRLFRRAVLGNHGPLSKAFADVQR